MLWAMDNEQKTKRLLTKLRAVFKDGYRPARGFEPYNEQLKMGLQISDFVNCFGHTLNLRNAQLYAYQILPDLLYSNFPSIDRVSNGEAAHYFLDFLREIGLKVQPCDPGEPINDFKSWKIAMYYDNGVLNGRDFHFLLHESPQLWSSKVGFTPYVEHIVSTTPPTEYHPESVPESPIFYELHDTYKITNPNADPNNRYVQNYHPDRLI